MTDIFGPGDIAVLLTLNSARYVRIESSQSDSRCLVYDFGKQQYRDCLLHNLIRLTPAQKEDFVLAKLENRLGMSVKEN